MASTFEPIAIVGRACVLPGALTPEQLWSVVAEGRDMVGPVPEGRWAVATESVLCAPDGPSGDRTWSDRGGYVRGFEGVFDADGFAVPASELAGLDPVFLWTLHTAREALRDAGDRRDGAVERPRVGAVIGNLGFPTKGMAEYAAKVWSGEEPGDPRQRFMGSAPAKLLTKALGLGGGAFCLDAACASSLYAIKLACDQLHDGDVDVALAGAVQAADDLFLHMGFCALGAYSKTGRSRPFNADADGLVAAEGAGFVALKRLADARRDGDHVYGVIRGVGLANDGRGKSLLAPAAEGQARAIQQAYDVSGLKPSQVSLLECHATGTSVGDGIEVASTAKVYAGLEGVPMGSLKSNLGHLITTAGVAGLIKVMEAMRAGMRPPTLHATPTIAALADSPFRLLNTSEPWESEGDEPRLAGVSAFGFGGNNAHLLVSEESATIAAPALAEHADAGEPIALVAIGAVVGSAANRDAFQAALLGGESLVTAAGEARTETVDLDLKGLRFPPKDLHLSNGQQLATLRAAREAVAEAGDLPRERTGVLIGMEPDAEVARWGFRWRLPESKAALRDRIIAVLESSQVVGSMPNIPANRLSSQFDVAGPAFVISAGAESGLVALQVASRALRHGELDAVIVGAADMSCEPVNRTALGSDAPAGDAAVVWVLKRLADARVSGNTVYALVADTPSRNDVHATHMFDDAHVGPLTGSATAASAFVNATAAALAVHQRSDLKGHPWVGYKAGTRVAVVSKDVALAEDVQTPPSGDHPRLYLFAAADRDALLARLTSGKEGGDGPCRLAFVSRPEGRDARLIRARAVVAQGQSAGPGVHFQEAPIEGELAFAYAGAGSAYPGMGHALLRALPSLADRLVTRTKRLPGALAWAWEPEEASAPTVLEQLWGASALCQLHTELTRGVLGLKPDAVLGYSSGETNSLLAMGVWKDIDALVAESEETGMFTETIGGSFDAVKAQWGDDVDWSSWAVLAPVEDVRAALEGEDRVHLAIVHTASDCVVAGDAAGCDRVVAAIGRGRCLRLTYDLAVHVPELGAIEDAWLKLHHRETTAPDGVRVYGNAAGRSYEPTADACAQAILGQADRTLELPPTIEAAWNDGVRIFVEHGPQAAYGRWIRETLGDREALVVSLDRKGQGIGVTLDAVAALWAAGVDVDHQALTALLPAKRTTPSANRRDLTFAVHPPAIDLSEPKQAMPHAPTLPLVLSDWRPLAPREFPTTAATIEPAVPAPVPVPGPLPPTTQPFPSHTAHAAPTQRIPSPAAATPSSPVLQRHMAHLTQIGEMQRAFVTQQNDLHTRFLQMRQTAVQTLLNAAGGAAMPGPAPIMPPAPPAPPIQARTPAPMPAARPAAPSRVPAATVLPPAPKPARVATKPARAPIAWDREQLKIHAGGRISEIFGAEFAPQDVHNRQVRMPEEPLLLCDRVMDIHAVPRSMATGSVITETDVRSDSWWLHQGRMPAGILIESGQADLFLVSYLGIDLVMDRSKGDRVYRLLGCELTYHGDLPQIGDTLQYDIHIDGHARQGDIRLMFFHYACQLQDGRKQLTVREGQAGFFSDAELADSDGCLWTPEGAEPVANPRLDAPAVVCTRDAFTDAQVLAFSEGRAAECFGPGFEGTLPHTRTPSIQDGQMLLLDRVTRFEGPGGESGWGRGYLRAELDITPEQWFFEGHFKNDPCMPGTLMFEGCLQAMAFYLAGLGYTLTKDAWRFQPVPELPYALSCRGQVLPKNRLLVTEVFVEEVVAGPKPTLYADLLCTVDGLKAFHAKRVALELVPDWPLEAMPEVIDAIVDAGPVAAVNGFEFGYASMLACAWGKPSKAFGPMYERFDGTMPVARLPGPPYHFVTRVEEVDAAAMGVMKAGATVTIAFDVPEDAWYFEENGCRTMPFAVLLEAALQPCGWLASYVGSALTVDRELGFRNLDGTGTLRVELKGLGGPGGTAGAETLRTKVKMTSVSSMGGMIIEGFEVECWLGEGNDAALVYDMTTKFGFFEPAALASQAGLPSVKGGGHGDGELLVQQSGFSRDLVAREGAYWEDGRPRLSEPMLLMLDRVTGYWPEGGEAGLGVLRGEKDVNPAEWFFEAHFFQDPVQPGSLGIEAMVQLLQVYMLEAGLDEGIAEPRFEALALGDALTWKYRGQVRIPNTLIHSTVEVLEVVREDGPGGGSVVARAKASLWVDGQRIYEAENLGMRIVSGGVSPRRVRGSGEVVLDPTVDTWVGDHRPTWTVPALPMMSIVDLLAAGRVAGADAGPVIGLRDVRVKSWLLVDGVRRLRTEVDGDVVTLFDADDGAELASAKVLVGAYGERPAALAALGGEAAESPYETGALFHGEAFQVLERLVQTGAGASSVLRAESGVPVGVLNPALLDGATHGIPHDRLGMWDERIGDDKVAYPALLQKIDFYGPTPVGGVVRCEVRPGGVLGGPDHPVFRIQLIGEDGVWAELKLVEACFPKGPLGMAAASDRRTFLRDREFVAGMRLSEVAGETSRLSEEVVAGSDWLPGTVEAVFGTRDVAGVAVNEHVGAAHGLHPRDVQARLPVTSFDGLEVRREGDGDGRVVEVAGDGRGVLDIGVVQRFWSDWFGIGPWPVEDLYYGLIEKFLGRVVLEDPEGFAALKGKSVLYLANHQVGVESLIFSVVASALNGVPTVTLAKAEHRTTWLGQLIKHCFEYPGVKDPGLMTFFDREDKASLPKIIGELAAEMRGPGRSVMVHVEGTRSLSCRTPVQKMSGAFVDMALAAGVPVVPVRFVGGLPVEPVETRLEFPVGMGTQDIWLGKALTPEMLQDKHYGARKAAVIDGINRLGLGNEEEVPSAAGDSGFAEACAAWQRESGVSAEHAVLRVLVGLAGGATEEALVGSGGDEWMGELRRWLLGAG